MSDHKLEEILLEQFQWFHSHPELAFEEFETTQRIRDILEKEGIEIMETGLETGLVARITGKEEGPVIGLRCDIDALPVKEESGLAYTSVNEGRMHACGHDFHTIVMVGAAILLHRKRVQLPGTVKVIFQPAEEVTGGAEGKKGIFIRIGTGGCYPGHHPKFRVDTDAIYPAARYMEGLAFRCLADMKDT